MVCKEDVLLWFRDLEGFKRIDVMFQLLNMCVPFEVRFLGTCIEEIGKHSYQELRGSFITANDIDKLTKDVSLNHSILDDGVRHRVLIYLSLLSGTNCKCANWYYQTLLRTESVEACVTKQNFKDENFKSELLLLFTLGLHHPAFTFDQKLFFGQMLEQTIKRECQKPLAAKTFPPYQPTLSHTNMQKVTLPTGLDIHTLTCMNSIPCHGGDAIQQQPPQGLIAHNLAPIELIQMWNRPGFPGVISGAPEMASFPHPQPPVSPLISQPTSPTPSRSSSPPRAFPFLAPAPLQPPNQAIEVLPMYSVPADPLSQSSMPALCSENNLNHAPDEKVQESNYTNPLMVRLNNMKPPNGVRYNSYSKVHQPYLLEQMQALSIDGVDGNFQQCSSSNSSSNNSLNHTPPDTPTVPVLSNHSPPNEEKARLNGAPPPPFTTNPSLTNLNAIAPPICDTSTPPPPLPTALSNCSVPYSSNYPNQVTAIPNRSVFNYPQGYRPPFSAPYNYPHSELIYFPVLVSSTISQMHPRNANNCYNCGAEGHKGAECTGQTIEDITQKKAYMLEYSTKLSDYDK